jgi:hypothetical protein
MHCQNKITVSPLLWACEIIFGSHYGDKLPQNWQVYAIQDAKKVIETLSYKVGKDVKFLLHGSVIVFLGTTPNENTRLIEERLVDFVANKPLSIKVVTAI